MNDSGFSTDEKHKATLDLLEVVAEYLERLPPVPMTRELCKRVREHLADPAHLLLVHAEVERRTRRQGSSFSASGAPLISAELRDHLITLRIPSTPSFSSDRQLLNGLRSADGLSMKLDQRLSQET